MLDYRSVTVSVIFWAVWSSKERKCHQRWRLGIHVVMFELPVSRCPKKFPGFRKAKIRKTRNDKRNTIGVIILPTQTRHYHRGNPSKLPYICIVWSSQKGHVMTPAQQQGLKHPETCSPKMKGVHQRPRDCTLKLEPTSYLSHLSHT